MTMTSNICRPGVQKQHTLHHRCSSETNKKQDTNICMRVTKIKSLWNLCILRKSHFFCLWNLLGQKCTAQLQYLFKRFAKYHGDILFKMMHVVTWIPFYFHWTRFFGNFDFVFLFQNVHLPRQKFMRQPKVIYDYVTKQCLVLTIMSMMSSHDKCKNLLSEAQCTWWIANTLLYYNSFYTIR